jgi:hypothetical protein
MRDWQPAVHVESAARLRISCHNRLAESALRLLPKGHDSSAIGRPAEATKRISARPGSPSATARPRPRAPAATDNPAPVWRRRRDSNPRYAFGAYNGLANRRLQPLGHISVPQFLTDHGDSGQSRTAEAARPRFSPRHPQVGCFRLVVSFNHAEVGNTDFRCRLQAIHVLPSAKQGADGRNKSGHDVEGADVRQLAASHGCAMSETGRGGLVPKMTAATSVPESLGLSA